MHKFNKILVQLLLFQPLIVLHFVAVLLHTPYSMLVVMLLLLLVTTALPLVSKCCDEGQAFYQDTMHCGVDTVVEILCNLG